MSLEIIRNDITKVTADAIVNTANPKVGYGTGVDSAIYNAAGAEELLAERKKIGEIHPGAAAITPAFNLDAEYIIHTVGPVWKGGNHGEQETVASCYRRSLNIAKDLECESVAFPLISTGNYGFPKDLALSIAIKEISEFLLQNEMTVYLVVYDKEAFELSTRLFNDIAEYIDDDEIRPREPSILNSYYLDSNRRQRRRLFAKASSAVNMESARREEMSALELEEFSVSAEMSAVPALDVADSADASIDEKLKNKDLTFQEHLFRIIDRKGLNDIDVYKRANIDRKHFSKIKSNVDYNPSKRTAVAFAIALGLNLDETKDLLLRAGIALSRSSYFDIIIEYCIEHHITDIYEINCILFKYDQPILGA